MFFKAAKGSKNIWFLILNDCSKKRIWAKAFKNGPIKICRRQPLKNLKWYSFLKAVFHKFYLVSFWILWQIEELLLKYSLHKICENTGFHWPVLSRIRTKSTILSFCERIRVCENPYSRIFYTVIKTLVSSSIPNCIQI